MSMEFRGLVWKRVWKMTFFGLKSGQDLKNRAAHPHEEFPGESAYIKRKTSNKKTTWGRQKIVYVASVAWLYVTQADKVSRPVSPQSFGRLPRFVRTFRASAKYSEVKKKEKVEKAFISVFLEESSKNLN